MITLRISEAELARDVHAVLQKVHHGSEVIIERDDRQAIAIISSPHRSGRHITDILHEASKRNSGITLDGEFSKDLEDTITTNQQPWNPPSWE